MEVGTRRLSWMECIVKWCGVLFGLCRSVIEIKYVIKKSDFSQPIVIILRQREQNFLLRFSLQFNFFSEQ